MSLIIYLLPILHLITHLCSSNSIYTSTMQDPSPSQCDSDDSLTCRVCMDRRIDCAFCPCGHVACCLLCAGQLDTCPLCRSLVVNRQVVFLPGSTSSSSSASNSSSSSSSFNNPSPSAVTSHDKDICSRS